MPLLQVRTQRVWVNTIPNIGLRVCCAHKSKRPRAEEASEEAQVDRSDRTAGVLPFPEAQCAA